MNLRKLLCLVMALTLALGTIALAETDDLQAQLDAANARVAELEALIEKYQPVYDSQVVATFGEDGTILKDDAQKEYESAAAMYSQYGISVDSYADMIKQNILETMVQTAVLDAKAAELGLAELDEETLAGLDTEAQSTFDKYVDSYKSYFAQDSEGNEVSDEDAIAQVTEYLKQNGVTVEAIKDSMVKNHISEQLHDYVVKDVAATDEDVQATYKQMIEDDKASYAESDSAYNNARTQGTTIAWNPSGYRAVKHVLVKFSDEQATRYNELNNAIKDLNDELEALQNPEPEATEAPAEEAEPAEEAAEEAEPAEEAEETAEAEEEAEETAEAEEEPAEAPAEPRTIEQVQTDLGVAGAELEALYSELMPKAQEVIDAFNNGTGIDELIKTYGEDPGMTTEPSATQGYAVAEGSTYWEEAFTKGAMSIAEIGQISEPVRGSNGIHIIYYMSDIPEGDVAFEDIEDAVKEKAQSDKVSETYNAQVTAWVEEAAPAYFLERF